MNQSTLAEIAIHEAGHAVCSMLLGKPSGCAVFEGDAGGSPGGVAGNGAALEEMPEADNYMPEKLSGQYEGSTPRRLLERATVFAAGDVAVRLGRMPCTLRPWQDRIAIYEMARAFIGGEDLMTTRRFTELAEANAERILGPVFFRVRAVADALVERRRLTADEVRTVFDETKGTEDEDTSTQETLSRVSD